jgi:pyrroline-5-carboxylate reductase
MKITFLGGGNMASALIGGLLNQGFSPEEMAVIEIGAENRARLKKAFGVRCYAEPEDKAMQCDALMLAVKPLEMREACTPLQKYLEQQLVISIAAGLRLADLSRWLGGHDKLVRAMPNTPALIGSGVTGLPCG